MNEKFLNENDEELYEEKNNNYFKYILIGITTVIILLLLLFLLKNNRISRSSLKEQMKDYSKQYFEKYMSINDNTNEYIVTLDMLENANKQGETFNLKGLEKCKRQTTTSKIIVDSKAREIKKIEVEVNC